MLLYALIVAASFFLASSGALGVFRATLFNTPKGILLLVVAPLALIVFLGLLLFGIMSDSTRRNRTNRAGNRIFLAFCLVIVASTVPQTIIVGRFVTTALRSWFSSSMSESLQSANEIADLYMAERKRLIELVAEKYLNGLSIDNYRDRPVDWMTQMRTMDPDAAACQVYLLSVDPDGVPRNVTLLESGDSDRFIPRLKLDAVHDGLFSLEGDDDVLRWGQIVRYGRSTYLCAYASRIPAGFREKLEQIRAAREQAHIIDTLDPYLPAMSIWIFLMFCLPSALMVIVISFLISVRLTDPLRALEEATARLAEGDSSFRLVTHANDEFSQTAVLLNSVAESVGKTSEKAKQADKTSD